MSYGAHIPVSDGPLHDNAMQETNNQTADYREQQMKENKPSEDPETILPDGNTLIPTRAVELGCMRCEGLAKVAPRHTIW